jgi:tetratricopeptide (TPR) repeat protein
MSRLLPFLTALVAVVVAIAYVEMRAPVDKDPAPADSAREDELARRVAALEEAVRELAARAPAPLPDTPSRTLRPAADPDVLDAETAPDGAGAAPEPTGGSPEQVEALLARLERGGVTAKEFASLWGTLVGSGMEDRAIEAIRAYAEKHPNDADAFYGLGTAYTIKLVGAKNLSYADQGVLSDAAHKAYDRALEIDDRHFGARLSRAISYTHWPEAFGKGPVAIRDFEILRERHGRDPSQEGMAEAYYYLGVQYQKAGDTEKAIQIFREGVETFPETGALREQLEAVEKAADK